MLVAKYEYKYEMQKKTFKACSVHKIDKKVIQKSEEELTGDANWKT